ncbi:MAG: hypothetical protein WC145_12710 [Aliarcobacter sp.]
MTRIIRVELCDECPHAAGSRSCRASQWCDEGDILSTAMGQGGCDLYLSPAARERFPFGVECKRTEKLSIPAWWKQCSANAKVEKLNPMLIYRRSHEEALLVMRWDDFLEVVRKNE